MTRKIIIKQLMEVCNQDIQKYIEGSDNSDRIDEIQEAVEDQVLAALNSTPEEYFHVIILSKNEAATIIANIRDKIDDHLWTLQCLTDGPFRTHNIDIYVNKLENLVLPPQNATHKTRKRNRGKGSLSYCFLWLITESRGV